MSKCEQCIVRQLSSLKALNKQELLRVAACKTSQIIKKGEPIFEEGASINGVFCVKSGVCKLTKLSENGKSQIVKFVKPGNLLGQRSVISDSIVNLSAVALEDMEVCFIPKQELVHSFRGNADFSTQMMLDVCNDLKQSDTMLVNMAQKTVKQRLAAALLYLDTTFGQNPDGSIKIQLSREEIASMVGTATESLIRMLSDFSKKQLICTKAKRITITDSVALKKLAEGVL